MIREETCKNQREKKRHKTRENNYLKKAEELEKIKAYIFLCTECVLWPYPYVLLFIFFLKDVKKSTFGAHVFHLCSFQFPSLFSSVQLLSPV